MTGRMVGPNNAVKTVKVGFSWTMLFFGVLVPLIRGDVKWFFLSLVISGCTLGIGWLVFPFVYNKIYIKGLLEKGYKPEEVALETELQTKGIMQ